jgi:hypothetical protein
MPGRKRLLDQESLTPLRATIVGEIVLADNDVCLVEPFSTERGFSGSLKSDQYDELEGHPTFVIVQMDRGQVPSSLGAVDAVARLLEPSVKGITFPFDQGTRKD